MGTFFDSLKYRFKQKDILVQLITINVAVFVILSVYWVITKLFLIQGFDLTEYIGVPDSFAQLLFRPWTIITYMFVHEGLLHILFNMLMLYWFGQIYLTYFNSKSLGSLYVLGGIAGALLYMLAYNTIPLFQGMRPSILIGASASVMAIIFAVAFYNPNAKIGLLLLGPVKIVYIAIFLFIIDFMSLDNPSNPGGHVAHIGGAILGYIYAIQYRKGKDITRWITRIIDWVANLSKPRPKKAKMKVKVKNDREKDYEYNERKKKNTQEINDILDKIKKSGYSSLTAEEKKRLFDASKN